MEVISELTPVPFFAPRYNGSREAGIGALKNHTHEHAASFGRPGLWTSEDVEAARRHSNEIPKEHKQSTALEIWESRDRIDDEEREHFYLTVARIRSQMQAEMDRKPYEEHTAATQAAIERRVVRQALEELGILSTKWRSIPLPIKPRKCARIL